MSNDEPPRDEPNFRVYVERDGAKTDVTHAVMDAYDISINSMDFGSGFLSTEEVGTLRSLGKAIGAKRFDYQHDRCLRCGHEHNRHYTGHHYTDHPCFVGNYPNSNEDPCSCTGFISPK